MPLSGPDNWGRFYPPRKKRWSLMGGVSPVEGTINQLDPNWSGIPRASSPNPLHSSVRGGPGSSLYGRSGTMAGKKGLSVKNMINAMSKLKSPTGEDFSKVSGRVGSNPLAKFSPMPGLNPNYDYSYGGLDFDPLKRQKKMMGSLV